MNIAAIVVTYFPDAKLLDRLLRSISNDVGKVYVIDNTPSAGSDWLTAEWFATAGYAVEFHALGENRGIAAAQNVGIELAIRYGFGHIILFDQDSAPSPGMIGSLYGAADALSAAGVKVGAVGPLLFDEKYKKFVAGVRHSGMFVRKVPLTPEDVDPAAVDYLIASGALISTQVLQEVGLMREELFIDWVDIEWGLRAENFGRKHFMIPAAVMYHSIGDEFVSAGTREINLHNDVRNYYIVRNACYLLSDGTLNWRWRFNIFLKIPAYLVFYSFFSTGKSRINSFRLLVRACADGFRGRVGKAF
jgi:rhamnosyltransferase